MATWTAFFDASGHESDPRTPFVTVAGFLSTAEQWVAFDELWRKRLGQDGLKYFRMVEFAQCVKQFDGWRNQEDRRQRLLGDLVDLIKSHAFRKFATVVKLEAIREMDNAVRDEFHLTAYVLAGRASGGDVRQWILSQKMTATPVAFVFEDGDPGRGNLRQRFESDGLGTPNFAPKKDTIKNGILEPGIMALQAADILAYEMSLCAKRESVTRWAAEELMRMPGRVGIFDYEDIQDLQNDLEHNAGRLIG